MLWYRKIKERVDNNLSYYPQIQDSVCLAPYCIIALVRAIVYSHDIYKKENKFQTYDFWLILQDRSAINSLLNGS